MINARCSLYRMYVDPLASPTVVIRFAVKSRSSKRLRSGAKLHGIFAFLTRESFFPVPIWKKLGYQFVWIR